MEGWDPDKVLVSRTQSRALTNPRKRAEKERLRKELRELRQLAGSQVKNLGGDMPRAQVGVCSATWLAMQALMKKRKLALGTDDDDVRIVQSDGEERSALEAPKATPASKRGCL